MEPHDIFHRFSERGSYLQAVLARNTTMGVLQVSMRRARVRFCLLRLPVFALLTMVTAVAGGAEDHRAESLLQWAKRGTVDRPPASQSGLGLGEQEQPFLVVGVKTSVLHGFHYRQAMRQTWMAPSPATQGTKIFFLGCRPDLSKYSDTHQRVVQAAIALEKSVFGDLLTFELGECDDGYLGLVQKTNSFMRWVARLYPLVSYVMINDEDTYVRLDRILELLQRENTPRTLFYAGNSATSWSPLGKPFRDPSHKFYMPPSIYPLNLYPPYVTGAHMLFSADLVRFFARNFHFLKGLGGLEDLSLGASLFMTMHVRPHYVELLRVLSLERACDDRLLSLSDVSPDDMWKIHDNLSRGRRFCYEFDITEWEKKTREIVFNSENWLQLRPSGGSAELKWLLQYQQERMCIQIVAVISAEGDHAELTFVPSLLSAQSGLCNQLKVSCLEVLYLAMYGDACGMLTQSLDSFLRSAAQDQPAWRAQLTLTLHNLKETKSEEIVIHLAKGVEPWRAVIECLFTRKHPHSTVLVLNSQDLPASGVRPHIVVSLSSTGSVLDQWSSRVTLYTEETGMSVDLSIPLVARTFAETTSYSPRGLLRPARRADGSHGRKRVVYVGRSVGTNTSLSVQVPLPLLRSLGEWSEADAIDVASRLVDNASLFLDQMVSQLSEYDYVVIMDTADADGVAAWLHVATFLAGAVAVHVGTFHSSLFNPRGFVQCGSFATYKACGSFTLSLNTSSEPAVTNMAEFRRVFSWHPEVFDMKNE